MKTYKLNHEYEKETYILIYIKLSYVDKNRQTQANANISYIPAFEHLNCYKFYIVIPIKDSTQSLSNTLYICIYVVEAKDS